MTLTQDKNSHLTSNASKVAIVIPVGRGKALAKGVVLLLPGALLGLVVGLILNDLHFVPTGASNRIVDYAIAAIAVALAVVAIILLIRGGMWLTLSLWPGKLGICFDAHELRFCIGPFKNRRYTATELRITYPFETIEDGEDVSFEAYLPEEEQVKTLMPAIVPIGADDRLDRKILLYSKWTELQIAEALRGILGEWRSKCSIAPDADAF